MSNLSFNELQNLVLKWNIDFPIDRWWRKAHSIPFNSKSHREVTFIDMFIEWQEERLFEEVSKEIPRYNPNMGDYLTKRPVDETLSEESFSNIDLDAI